MSFSLKRYFQQIIICSLILLNFTIYEKVFKSNNVRFVFFDVGQGDACLIYDKNNSILIDAGYAGFGKDYGKTVILPYMQSKGISNIDVAILSHPHADHIGGLYHLLKNTKIHEIWDTYHHYNSRLFHSILDIADSTNTTINYPQPGETYVLGELSLKVLFPNKSISTTIKNVNDASIVLRIDHGENSFLFTGDAEKFAEHIYGKLGELLDVDVVKVGHHGSKTSSSQKIIQSTSADAVVVSLGKGNKYGHPSTKILENWRNSGAEIFRTDLHGAIIIDSNGKELKFSKMID
jgi:competence protein ComEC